MINKLKAYLGSPRGFTLIETLIAVLLLSIAITGPLTIASKGLTATMVAKDQFIAFYLAQDAMEQVRYLRDSSCLTKVPDATGCPVASWLASLNVCKTSVNASGCYLDSTGFDPATPTACPAGGCPVMFYDSSTNSYRYTAGAQTPQRFVRTVKITNSVADEAIVTVTVTWTDLAGVTHQPVTIRENIFRWE